MEIINVKHSKKYIKYVAKLQQELWSEDDIDSYIEGIKEKFKNRYYNVFLAMDDNIPLGYVETFFIFSHDEKISETPILKIDGLYTAKKYRKQGIASQLVTYLDEYAYITGCHQIASEFYEDNKNSKNFHEKMGFHETNKLISVIKDVNKQ